MKVNGDAKGTVIQLPGNAPDALAPVIVPFVAN